MIVIVQVFITNKKNVFMIKQHPAQIYKSDGREIAITETGKHFLTINSSDNQDDSNYTFDALKHIKEEIFLPKCSTMTMVESSSDVIILPLFGGIEYKDSLGNEDFIRVEQVSHIAVEKGMSFELYNPYGQNVSCLQIWLNAKEQHPKNNCKLFDFDLSQKNQLIPLFQTYHAVGFIGIFEGRKEGLYPLKDASNGVFVFVINGAFEVENRLLEARDGLRIEKIEAIEWEALSADALLIVLEIPSYK